MRYLFIIGILLAIGLSVHAQPVADTGSVLLDTVVMSYDTAAVDSIHQVLEKAPKSTKKNAFDPSKVSDIISAGKIFWMLVFLVFGYLIIRFISSILGRLAERSTHYRITIKGLIPIVRIFGWIIILIVIIGGIFQPQIATVITVTASVAIAIGFAAQDILKNMFGGIMILFDRPFQVGDKIAVKDHYGEVIQIGLRSTRIVTPGDSMVSIPNGEFMSNTVSNANNGEANCQVQAELFLPVTIDTQLVRQIAIEAAQVSRYIFLNKPIVVLFTHEVKEDRSYLKMSLKAYVADIRNEMSFKSDMTEIVMRELLEKHIVDPEKIS